MTTAASLADAALRAANIPIDGVSVVDTTNRATWRVDFMAAATSQQKTQAATILATLDLTVPTGPLVELAKQPLLVAVAATLAKRTGATLDAVKADIKAFYTA
ncbi:MAG TPA: hypothetical protein VNJ04_12090 [Gemmatimonadaceae bacterium]|nr:hypothetical protein [Gemmatimonadaceae bacterium]